MNKIRRYKIIGDTSGIAIVANKYGEWMEYNAEVEQALKNEQRRVELIEKYQKLPTNDDIKLWTVAGALKALEQLSD